jgi:hypothetical protein
MKTYIFRVTDSQGIWGDLRQRAKSVAKARRICRAYLVAEEVEPKGLLLSRFRLTLIP